MQLVRIRYWVQDTMDSGSWHLTGLMSRKTAEKLINDNIVESGVITEDSDYVDEVMQ